MKKIISVAIAVGISITLFSVSIPTFAAQGSQIITATIQPSRVIILDSQTLEIKEIKSNTGCVLGISPEKEKEKIHLAVYIGRISNKNLIGLSEEIWDKYLQVYPIIDWSKTGVVYRSLRSLF